MKEKFKILGVRGTIFLPSIGYSKDLFNVLPEKYKSYTPTVNFTNGPAIFDGNLLNPSEWILSSPDRTQSINFNNQKIDLLFQKSIDYSIIEMKNFTDEFILLLKTILKFKECMVSRIAVAPSFTYIGENKDFKYFVNKIFSSNKYKDSEIDNCDFSQVYRVNEKIKDKQVSINYLSKFYTKSDLVLENGVNEIKESVMVDFDINTKNDQNISFNIDEVIDFFHRAPEFCDEFMAYYFDQH